MRIVDRKRNEHRRMSEHQKRNDAETSAEIAVRMPIDIGLDVHVEWTCGVWENAQATDHDVVWLDGFCHGILEEFSYGLFVCWDENEVDETNDCDEFRPVVVGDASVSEESE